MIDATKLVGGARYWIHCQCDNVWRLARYRAAFEDFASEVYDYGISEVTAAIPIPTPDELGVMREVISDVANSGIEHTNAGKYHVMQIDIETYNKARTLLEKMQ